MRVMLVIFAPATQTQLVGTFANNIIGYEGDKGTAIPTLTVTAGSTTLKANEYTVEYSSSNPTAIEISNGKINLNAPSEAGSLVVSEHIHVVNVH